MHSLTLNTWTACLIVIAACERRRSLLDIFAGLRGPLWRPLHCVWHRGRWRSGPHRGQNQEVHRGHQDQHVPHRPGRHRLLSGEFVLFAVTKWQGHRQPTAPPGDHMSRLQAGWKQKKKAQLVQLYPISLSRFWITPAGSSDRSDVVLPPGKTIMTLQARLWPTFRKNILCYVVWIDQLSVGGIK